MPIQLNYISCQSYPTAEETSSFPLELLPGSNHCFLQSPADQLWASPSPVSFLQLLIRQVALWRFSRRHIVRHRNTCWRQMARRQSDGFDCQQFCQQNAHCNRRCSTSDLICGFIIGYYNTLLLHRHSSEGSLISQCHLKLKFHFKTLNDMLTRTTSVKNDFLVQWERLKLTPRRSIKYSNISTSNLAQLIMLARTPTTPKLVVIGPIGPARRMGDTYDQFFSFFH